MPDFREHRDKPASPSKGARLGPARGMGEYVSEVVSAATSGPRGPWRHSAVRCRRRPSHRKCLGRLLVCEKDNGDIEYKCPRCSELGVIRGWEDSFSDLSELRDEGSGPAFEVLLTEQEYDKLKSALAEDYESDLIIYGATCTEDGIVLRADATEMKIFASCLADDMECAQNPRQRAIIRQVQENVRALLGRWSAG